jgi:DNA-binding NtrC family response regulator
VALCNRGEEFFQHLEEQKPDLVLLDIYMGDVNGIQLLNKMRADGWDSPVIIMTAHSDVSLAVRAWRKRALRILW